MIWYECILLNHVVAKDIPGESIKWNQRISLRIRDLGPCQGPWTWYTHQIRTGKWVTLSQLEEEIPSSFKRSTKQAIKTKLPSKDTQQWQRQHTGENIWVERIPQESGLAMKLLYFSQKIRKYSHPRTFQNHCKCQVAFCSASSSFLRCWSFIFRFSSTRTESPIVFRWF